MPRIRSKVERKQTGPRCRTGSSGDLWLTWLIIQIIIALLGFPAARAVAFPPARRANSVIIILYVTWRASNLSIIGARSNQEAGKLEVADNTP